MTLWLSLFTALLACVIFFFVYQIHECKKGIACTLEILYRDAIQIGRRLEQMPTQAELDAAIQPVADAVTQIATDVHNLKVAGTTIPQATIDSLGAIKSALDAAHQEAVS